MSLLTFLGDISLLNSSMRCEYKINNDFVFNLEYVLTDDQSTPKKNKVNLCGSKINFAEFFNRNPTAVNLANNHIMDYKDIGFQETIKKLEKQKINYFGAGEIENRFGNPLFIELHERKVAIMGYSMFDEHTTKYSVDYFNKEKVIKDIDIAKKYGANTLLVNMHWGIEQDPYFTDKQREIGRFLIDNGIDLVIGHHSHCLQPFEKYKGKYIFYSLGNCVFPDFHINAFFDESGISQRTHRKRQLKINRESYAVNFDVIKNEVVLIDKLIFKNDTLKKVAKVPLDKRFSKPFLGQILLTKLRKRLIFIYSNSFVNGKIFDFNAFKHEVFMKIKR